jgi:predicted DNA binding CopG/RHH family protein
MKSSKKIVNVRFDEEKWKKVKEIAEKQGMSASAFVRKCVYECLENDKRK